MRSFSPGRGLGGGTFLTNKWFVLMGASIIFILTIVLIALRRFRLDQEKAALDRKFDEYAENHGLSQVERNILLGITRKSLVRRKDAIFTLMAAFNRGSLKYMQEMFGSIQNPVERKKLNTMVDSIREKLGFRKKLYSYGVRSGRGRSLILRNNEHEFVVRTEAPVSSVAGTMWNIRYRLGAATWEFNVLTIACGDNEVVLNHSDNITFVNRRKFLRVDVQKPALVAHFPQVREISEGGWMAPEFVSAMVTQLSGPGLRIVSDIEVKSGDRLLLVFELDDGKIVQDIAEVRGYRDRSEDHSIGVELIGLNEAGVDELVRTTNHIAISSAVEESCDTEDVVLAGGQDSG
jgi:hypothetical protein